MSRKHLPRRRALALLPALLLAAQADAKGAKKPAAVPLRGEQAEIESVLREVEYLRERVQALQANTGVPPATPKSASTTPPALPNCTRPKTTSEIFSMRALTSSAPPRRSR